MKTALVYDWLGETFGGGEQTFIEIAKLVPNADIFCLTYESQLYGHKLGPRTIKTSWLQKLPKPLRRHRRLLMPLVRLALRSYKLADYDLVFSVSGAWAKNVRVSAKNYHVCYCFTPARFLWQDWPAIVEKRAGGSLLRPILQPWILHLRRWDVRRAAKVNRFLTLSKHIARQITRLYHQDAEVIYPAVTTPKDLPPQPKADYYVMLTTLARYKNIELAIHAFTGSSRQLVIAGDGADRARLEKLASGAANIRFVGRVNEVRKWELLAGAKALLMTNVEDFGIAPVEALSVGTPVIALRGGGVSETVEDGVHGLFFDSASPISLRKTLDQFEKRRFGKATLMRRASEFSPEHFEAAIQRILREVAKELKQ